MSPIPYLKRAKPCRRCGVEIPAGAPLAALDWDASQRAWAHWRPSCDELRELAPVGEDSTESLPPSAELAESSEALGVRSEPGVDRSAELFEGSWSVTVEFHEAADPAQSKRVLRIARLHLRTFEGAREVAEKLQKEL
jgi:hypothetical protein